MKLPDLMGIINVAPNSFYSESRFPEVDAAIAKGLTMIEEGATMLDIGGVPSSHFREGYSGEGASPVSEEEELARVVPVVKALARKVQVSVDTCRPKVAEAVIEAGAAIINDITGLRNPDMLALVRGSGVKCVIMHMQGTPETMQQQTDYNDGVVAEVYRWLEEKSRCLEEHQVILDPGFCFGKSVEDNYELLRALPQLCEFGFPVLVGISRKSMMERILKKPAAELLPPTLALDLFAWQQGASILRVHDVGAHFDALSIYRHAAQAAPEGQLV